MKKDKAPKTEDTETAALPESYLLVVVELVRDPVVFPLEVDPDADVKSELHFAAQVASAPHPAMQALFAFTAATPPFGTCAHLLRHAKFASPVRLSQFALFVQSIISCSVKASTTVKIFNMSGGVIRFFDSVLPNHAALSKHDDNQPIMITSIKITKRVATSLIS